MSRLELAVSTARNLNAPQACLELFIATQHASYLNITAPMSRITLQIRAYGISPSAHHWGLDPDRQKLQTAAFPMRSGTRFAWSFRCGGARILPLKAAGDEGWKRGAISIDTYPASGAHLRALLPLVLGVPVFPRRFTSKTCGQEMPIYYSGHRGYGIMALWLHDMLPVIGFWYFPRNAAGTRWDLGQIKAVRAAESWVGFFISIMFFFK